MKRKGQGAFEYVLLLGGVLLIVVLAVVLLRGGLFESSSGNVQLTACKNSLATASDCFEGGSWNSTGIAKVSDACRDILNSEDLAAYDCGGVPGDGNCFCGPSPA